MFLNHKKIIMMNYNNFTNYCISLSVLHELHSNNHYIKWFIVIKIYPHALYVILFFNAVTMHNLYFLGGGVVEYRFGKAIYCGYYRNYCNQYDFTRKGSEYTTDLDTRTLLIP